MAREDVAAGEEVLRPLDDRHRDRLMPFFVVRQLPSPLPGLLIAAVFGATMAVVSAGSTPWQPRRSWADFGGRGGSEGMAGAEGARS